jgi:hypothetical protein
VLTERAVIPSDRVVSLFIARHGYLGCRATLLSHRPSPDAARVVVHVHVFIQTFIHTAEDPAQTEVIRG